MMPTKVELLGTADDPPRYRWPFTIADQTIIDALDERTRDAVERYVRASGIATVLPNGALTESQLDDLADRIAENIDVRGEVYSGLRSALRRGAA
jgi:hypothetical protein